MDTRYILLYLIMIGLYVGLPLLVFFVIAKIIAYELCSRKSNRGYCIKGDGDKALALKLSTVSGKGFVYETTTSRELLCARHAKETYRDFQTRTLSRGWWSLYGIIRTPAYLLMNSCYYFAYKVASKRVDRLAP